VSAEVHGAALDERGGQSPSSGGHQVTRLAARGSPLNPAQGTCHCKARLRESITQIQPAWGPPEAGDRGDLAITQGVRSPGRANLCERHGGRRISCPLCVCLHLLGDADVLKRPEIRRGPGS
jgi:hypothetical protein